jgi:hypothetical protein
MKYGGFLKWEGTPNHSKLEHCSIETHGDLGIPPRTPHMIFIDFQL